MEEKKIIQRVVLTENSKNLSDEEICRVLEDQGINVDGEQDAISIIQCFGGC